MTDLNNFNNSLAEYGQIQTEIIHLLETSKRAVARNINSIMTATYWEIGRRIVEFEQGGEGRAGYGELLIERLAIDLTQRFGRGFSQRNLEQMRAFYFNWPITQTVSALFENSGSICQTLSGKFNIPNIFQEDDGSFDLKNLAKKFALSWSAYVCLLSVKNPEARRFYEIEAFRCGWSVRQLARQIDSQFYERIALSRNKAAMLEKSSQASPEDFISPEEAIRDPFIFEFLDLKDEYSESDLEDALIQHLADFLLELGDDFAFIGRQRRLRIDDTWFRVDLLFFHRRLQCLVIIDLKTGKFSHADAGQMHLYLNYAREHWMKPGENLPVGLILCASKGASEAHYALDGLPNKVLAAEYQMLLPKENVLIEELDRSRRELESRKLIAGENLK